MNTRPFCAGLLAFFALLPSAVCAQEMAQLVMDARAQMLRTLTRDPGREAGHWTSGWAVKNLTTGKTYGGMVLNATIDVLDVPEGIYCLDSVLYAERSVRIDYCGEPYFKVVGGRVNNAGRWRIGITRDFDELRLFESMSELEATLEEAKQRFPERFPAPKQ